MTVLSSQALADFDALVCKLLAFYDKPVSMKFPFRFWGTNDLGHDRPQALQ